RTREIGIRMALGAERSAIMSLILRQGMKLVVAGIGVGLLIAAGASRVLGSLLFGVGPADPVVFLGAAALFCAAGAAACFVPVRRATAIDATVALRAE
ncbi:MAG TPA: FtsX-like permease family protein, partial [Thermoanaerobaculia bacterium]|nr:FtsX-like permease family protein [Thermoanaerobaculia bacterium]